MFCHAVTESTFLCTAGFRKTFNRELSASKSMAGLCSAFGEVYEAKYPARAHTTVFYKDFAFPEARALRKLP